MSDVLEPESWPLGQVSGRLQLQMDSSTDAPDLPSSSRPSALLWTTGRVISRGTTVQRAAPEHFPSMLMRLSKITVEQKKNRPGRYEEVGDLLESLPDVGLLHPVLILPSDEEGRHELLAGHRRLRAACQLGWEEIPARIVTLDAMRAELAALAENLVRRPFSPSDELRAVARAKEIYEGLHPEAKQGGARRVSAGQDGHVKAESFAEYTAKSSGQSARPLRRKALVGEKADADTLSALDEGTISLTDAEKMVGSRGPGGRSRCPLRTSSPPPTSMPAILETDGGLSCPAKEAAASKPLRGLVVTARILLFPGDLTEGCALSFTQAE